MSTWILILTLASVPSNGGSAMTSVPGFADKPGCQAAGDAWIKSNPQSGGTYLGPNQRPTFVCVEQKR